MQMETPRVTRQYKFPALPGDFVAKARLEAMRTLLGIYHVRTASNNLFEMLLEMPDAPWQKTWSGDFRYKDKFNARTNIGKVFLYPRELYRATELMFRTYENAFAMNDPEDPEDNLTIDDFVWELLNNYTNASRLFNEWQRKVGAERELLQDIRNYVNVRNAELPPDQQYTFDETHSYAELTQLLYPHTGLNEISRLDAYLARDPTNMGT